MFQSLLKYSSIFLKEAGLLKVPELLLQEVQDWALSVYFTKVKKLVENKYEASKKRNILVDKIVAETETRPFKRVKKALEEGDIQYLLPYEGNQFVFRLGSFENEPDSKTNLQGSYNNDRTACYLEIKKTKDPDKYDLFYSGYIFKSQNEFKNITFELFNQIWEDDLYNKLIKMFDEFDIFFNQIEKFSDNHIKNVAEELIECNSYIKEKVDIKHTNNFVEKSFYLNGQTIDVIFYFSNKEDRSGQWDEFVSKNYDSTIGFVKIFFEPEIPRYSDRYINVAERLKKIVRHELQHTIQTIIKRKTGLPRSTEKVPEGDMEVLPFMMPVKLRKNKIPDEVKEGPNANSDLEHAHRSIEYHTRVADSVNDFKLVINTVPKQFHKLYFEAWINHNSSFDKFFDNIKFIPLPNPQKMQSPFSIHEDIFIYGKNKFESVFADAYDKLHRNSAMFESFKEHNFEKYKLAVKEFYKEVQDLL